jgi:hypothetical protein
MQRSRVNWPLLSLAPSPNIRYRLISPLEIFERGLMERDPKGSIMVHGRFDDSDSNLCRMGERCVDMVASPIEIHVSGMRSLLGSVCKDMETSLSCSGDK